MTLMVTEGIPRNTNSAIDPISGTNAFIDIGNSNGVDDTAWMNQLFSAGGYFRGKPGQTYLLTPTNHTFAGTGTVRKVALVIPSNTTVDFTGCSFRFTSGVTTGNFIVNYAYVNPVTTGTDGTVTSGSAVITTALSTNPDVAAGQTLVLNGANGGATAANIPLCAQIVSVDSGAGTITVDTAATAASTNRGIFVYARDQRINIVGGSWLRGAVGGTSTIDGHSIVLRYLDYYTLLPEYQSSSNGAYGQSIAACNKGTVDLPDADLFLDGVHLMGPLEGLHLISARGTYGDDAFSTTAADYAGSLCDVSGPVRGVSWGIVDAVTSQSCVKIMSGVGGLVTDFVGGLTMGTPARVGVYIGEDTLNPGTTGGTFGKIDTGLIDIISTSAARAPLGLFGVVQADSIRTQIHMDTSAIANYAIQTPGGTSAGSISYLYADVDINSPAGIFHPTQSNQSFGTVIIDGYWNQTSAANNSGILLGNGTINRLETRGLFNLFANTLALVKYGTTTASVIEHVHTGEVRGGYLTQTIGAGTAYRCTFSGKAYNGLRVFQLLSSSNVITFAGGTIDTYTLRPITVSGGSGISLLVLGSVTTFTLSDPILITRPSTEVVRVNGSTLSAAVQDMTPAVGDICFNNANASGIFPAKGTAVYDGTIWRLASLAAVKSGSATLVAGAATIADAQITANSKIIVYVGGLIGGTPGSLFVSAKVAGTGFTITSSSALDTSVVEYRITAY